MAKVDAGRGKEPIRSSSDKDTRDVPAGPDVSRQNSSSTTGSDRCHHHHRSKKVHIRTRRLVDVTCEKCHRLWLAPGSNATRISLASRETIDPPPKDLENLTVLLRAIRSVNQVALSPSLPDIQEGASGISPVPPIARSQSRRLKLITRVERRLQRYLRERGLDTSDISSLSQTATFNTEVSPMTAVPAPLPSSSEDPGTDTRPAMAPEAQALSDARVMDVIMPMTPEERFEYMRRQVTAFSAEHGATPAPSPRESHLINREEDSSADQSIQDFLLGIGAEMIVRYSDPSLSTVSLQISETRTSEADTVVDGQVFTSTNFLREVFGRGYRLSVEISGQQARRDGVDRVGEHNRN